MDSPPDTLPLKQLEETFGNGVVVTIPLATWQRQTGAPTHELQNLGGYATTEWLRLTIPSPDDKTRSRWPIHPLWGYLSSIDWETSGGPLSRSYSPARVPGDAYLFDQGWRLLIAYMARQFNVILSKQDEAQALKDAEYERLKQELAYRRASKGE